jgi:phosphatidylethanolamine/phosphatidyl-N-methylethanolamine N-methyltransferase
LTTIFQQFLRKPQTTGAVAASSASLAREITSEVGLAEASVVVELGPGTGAFTGHILKAMRPGARFFAVERNAAMVATLRQRFPEVVVHTACATKLHELLEAEGGAKADVVICGLPWAAFPDGLQEQLLASISEALAPGGRFTTFAYLQGMLLPAGRKFRKRLDECFASVTRSRTVWANLPPAFCYRCRA